MTEAIREPEVTEAASRVSVHPRCARRWSPASAQLVAAGDWVAEGRDIGTVVSPDAPVKVFLTASAEERARRRAAEIGEDVDDRARDQGLRDARDASREHAPCAPPTDAVELDTTGLSLDEVVERIVGLARERGLA